MDRRSTPAEQAFQRLLRQYSDSEQRRIHQAMSILGITPDDKLWLAVVIGVDLIRTLEISAATASDNISNEITSAATNLTQLGKKLDDHSHDLLSAASQISVERKRTAKEIDDVARDAIAKIHNEANNIGDNISAQFLATLHHERKRFLTVLSSSIAAVFFLIGILAGVYFANKYMQTCSKTSYGTHR